MVTESDSLTNYSFAWLQIVTQSQAILLRGYRWLLTHKPFFRVVTDGESFTNHSFAWLGTDSDSLINHSSRGYR